MASAQVSADGYALRRRWYKANREAGADGADGDGSKNDAAAEREPLVPPAAGGAN